MIKLVAEPSNGSFQYEFEEIMMLIGWLKGALPIHSSGLIYLNHDVQRHWEDFSENKI